LLSVGDGSGVREVDVRCVDPGTISFEEQLALMVCFPHFSDLCLSYSHSLYRARSS